MSPLIDQGRRRDASLIFRDRAKPASPNTALPNESSAGGKGEQRLRSPAIAFAHFLAGRYDDASSWAQRALQVRPSYPSAIRLAAASSALAGRPEEARQAIERLRQVDPALRVSNLKDRLPLRRPDDLTRYQEGLRMAGLPEQ